jgi:hypothetical protein
MYIKLKRNNRNQWQNFTLLKQKKREQEPRALKTN